MGILNVTVGAGSEIGDHFVGHPRLRLISSFSGSTPAGCGIGRIAAVFGCFLCPGGFISASIASLSMPVRMTP